MHIIEILRRRLAAKPPIPAADYWNCVERIAAGDDGEALVEQALELLAATGNGIETVEADVELVRERARLEPVAAEADARAAEEKRLTAAFSAFEQRFADLHREQQRVHGELGAARHAAREARQAVSTVAHLDGVIARRRSGAAVEVRRERGRVLYV